jgi:hypothetical protein
VSDLVRKLWPLGHELVTQLDIVVNLAIKVEHETPVIRDKRLIRLHVQINDRQAPLTETHRAVHPEARRIGAAVHEIIAHTHQQRLVHGTMVQDHADKPTHI